MTDHIKKNFKIQWDQIKMMFWHPSLNPKVVSSYIFEIYVKDTKIVTFSSMRWQQQHIGIWSIS